MSRLSSDRLPDIGLHQCCIQGLSRQGLRYPLEELFYRVPQEPIHMVETSLPIKEPASKVKDISLSSLNRLISHHVPDNVGGPDRLRSGGRGRCS